ncbi:MAG: VCBS repeat-containing protein [Chitinophagaceae bacterium]|nr:MAG: VCBS repeat-containing protein [Chitinophagaceae bacterium]
MQNLLTPEQMEGALKLKATDLHSYYLQNDGNGKFTPGLLPPVAQISVLNGMVAEDFDHDGNLDLVATGNDFGTELSMGKYDGLNGIYLKGDGKGHFNALSILQSGIYFPGNGKALVKLRNSNGHYLLAASENQGPMKILQLRSRSTLIPVLNTDVSGMLKMKNGKMRKSEFSYGSSFLSQSSRFILGDDNIQSVEITDNKGRRRLINIE